MKKNPIKSGLRETMAGKVTFLFLLFLYTGVMLYLFWMECYQVPGFQSDMPDYVNKVAGIAGNYGPFSDPVLDSQTFRLADRSESGHGHHHRTVQSGSGSDHKILYEPGDPESKSL